MIIKSTSKIIQNHVHGTQNAGSQAILNHPNYHAAVSADDMHKVKGLYMLELLNGHPTVFSYGYDPNKTWDQLLLKGKKPRKYKIPSTEEIWDELLSKGMKIYGVSSGDTHKLKTRKPKDSNPGEVG